MPISSSDITLILAVRLPLLSSISSIILLSWLLADFRGLIIANIIKVIATPIIIITTSIAENAFTDKEYWLLSSSEALLTCALIKALRLSAAFSSLVVMPSSPSAVSSKKSSILELSPLKIDWILLLYSSYTSLYSLSPSRTSALPNLLITASSSSNVSVNV